MTYDSMRVTFLGGYILNFFGQIPIPYLIRPFDKPKILRFILFPRQLKRISRERITRTQHKIKWF